MSTSVFGLLLWAPFAVIVVLCGIFFCVRGYKTGLFTALLSVIATVAASIASILLAGVVTKPLAPLLAATVSLELPEFLGIAGIQLVLAPLLYGFFMVVLTPILKAIFHFLGGKAQHPVLKLTGLAVRFVDCLLFAALLQLPFYGALATYMPAMATVALQQEDMKDLAPYAQETARHPLVQLADTQPGQMLFDMLSQVALPDGQFPASQVVRSLSDGLELLGQNERIAELIDFLEERVVHEDWFYAISDWGMSFAKEGLAEKFPALAGSKPLEALTEMDKQAFTANCDAVLDFAGYLLEEEIWSLENPGSLNLEKLQTQQSIEKVGAFLNSTEEIAALKGLILSDVMEKAVEKMPQYAYLQEQLVPQRLTNVQEQLQEAEALIYGLEDPWQFILNHPAFKTE